MHSYTDVLNFLKDQTRKAGAMMRDRIHGPYQSYTKEDGSIVTDVDLDISKMIQENVPRFSTDIHLFSEESPKSVIDLKKKYFIIDELDGTRFFAGGMLGFSHQAAYYDSEAGLVVGMIYFPLEDILLYAVKNQGVFIETAGVVQKIEPVLPPAFEKMRFAQSAFFTSGKYFKLFEKMGVSPLQVILTSARRTLYLALGNLHVFFSLSSFINEWDWCGEQVIVKELGFVHSYLDGSPVRFGFDPPQNNRGYLICHESISEDMMQKINRHLI